MPQMAPYNWLYLNMMFSMILLIFISYTYYIAPKLNLKLYNNKNINKKFIYKW